MDLVGNLSIGFAEAFSTVNLLYCFLGVLLGTAIGVLPGLGPVPTIAMLLPLTFGLPPTTGLIMLAGIFYGSQYGGSTTAILLKLPGEISSVMTAVDGNKMARQGRAGAALTVAALGSFFAGCVATLFLAALAAPLTAMAIRFGPEDYFSLMVLGLVGAVALASGSATKAIGMVLLGMLFGLVGRDVTSGVVRYAFGTQSLSDGIDFVVIAMGLFGLAEVIATVADPATGASAVAKLGRLRLSRDEFRAALPAVLRGTGIGSLLGVLPGGGVVLSTFLSYALEKKVSRTPERFGQGAIEGVAAPEAANNAASQTTFVPLLVLGLPTNAVAALMAGAMLVHNIVPGPQVISTNPALFWGLIASMWLGNAMLLVLNLPLIGLWVRLLSIPYRLLYPAIVLFCCIGVYSTGYQVADVLLLVAFGALGYVFRLLDCEPAPLLMGAVLSPLIEEQLQRAMLMSRGDPLVFVRSPVSATLLAITVLVLVFMMVPAIYRWRVAHLKE